MSKQERRFGRKIPLPSTRAIKQQIKGVGQAISQARKQSLAENAWADMGRQKDSKSKPR